MQVVFRVEESPLSRAMSKPLVSDELWSRVEPLLPPEKPRRFCFPGRKPIHPRQLLSGIRFVLLLSGIRFVLRTGIRWDDLPAELGWGCGRTCREAFARWHRAGVWPSTPRSRSWPSSTPPACSTGRGRWSLVRRRGDRAEPRSTAGRRARNTTSRPIPAACPWPSRRPGRTATTRPSCVRWCRQSRRCAAVGAGLGSGRRSSRGTGLTTPTPTGTGCGCEASRRCWRGGTRSTAAAWVGPVGSSSGPCRGCTGSAGCDADSTGAWRCTKAWWRWAARSSACGYSTRTAVGVRSFFPLPLRIHPVGMAKLRPGSSNRR